MKDKFKIKREKKQRRAMRIRAKIFGTVKKPRLAIFRSNKHIYTQLLDDEKGVTVASASDFEINGATKEKKSIAGLVGQLIAKKAAALNIGEIVFDKRGYKYHGIVKSVAEGAREAGLKF